MSNYRSNLHWFSLHKNNFLLVYAIIKYYTLSNVMSYKYNSESLLYQQV